LSISFGVFWIQFVSRLRFRNDEHIADMTIQRARIVDLDEEDVFRCSPPPRKSCDPPEALHDRGPRFKPEASVELDKLVGTPNRSLDFATDCVSRISVVSLSGYVCGFCLCCPYIWR